MRVSDTEGCFCLFRFPDSFFRSALASFILILFFVVRRPPFRAFIPPDFRRNRGSFFELPGTCRPLSPLDYVFRKGCVPFPPPRPFPPQLCCFSFLSYVLFFLPPSFRTEGRYIGQQVIPFFEFLLFVPLFPIRGTLHCFYYFPSVFLTGFSQFLSPRSLWSFEPRSGTT